MLKDLLKETISLVAGKQSEDIVDLLDEQKYINEFIIAKKLNLTINQVRNILYKISDFGLVSYIRKKDKRKGWYTYFWKIEILKALEFLKENLLKKIDSIDHQIKSRETKRFYFCPRCHIELNEENALLNNFTCSECGSILELKDNSKTIKDLNREKEKLEREMALVEEEIFKEKEKEERKKIREMRKAEKIRKAELAKKKKKRNIVAPKTKIKKVKIKKKKITKHQKRKKR